MNILYGKTFGIGNAVMAIPAIRALHQLYPESRVDVLIGHLPEDFGARQVLANVVQGRGEIFVGEARQRDYDLAIMAIPFDGRWQNLIHYRALRVMDGRTRPDPSTTGLVSWNRHEVEYQMDNIRELGYGGPPPSIRFLDPPSFTRRQIYLGLGYKKDAAGFWKVKHWGNENYAELVSLLSEMCPAYEVVTTGDRLDMHFSIAPIMKMKAAGTKGLLVKLSHNIEQAFRVISESSIYVGNDTGMMHVAASCGIPVVSMFFLENSIVKSRPWCSNNFVFDGTKDRNSVTPLLVAQKVKEILDGQE